MFNFLTRWFKKKNPQHEIVVVNTQPPTAYAKKDKYDVIGRKTDVPQTVLLDNGQYSSYWVLSEKERKSGFIRPYRDTYIHNVCGTETRMAVAIAETYARSPKFYDYTYCATCENHFPVIEFVWKANPNEQVGS